MNSTVPEVISFAENQICFGEQCWANFAQSTVTTRTFETIFMPVLVQCLQQVTFTDWLVTTEAFHRWRYGQGGGTGHLLAVETRHHQACLQTSRWLYGTQNGAKQGTKLYWKCLRNLVNSKRGTSGDCHRCYCSVMAYLVIEVLSDDVLLEWIMCLVGTGLSCTTFNIRTFESLWRVCSLPQHWLHAMWGRKLHSVEFAGGRGTCCRGALVAALAPYCLWWCTSAQDRGPDGIHSSV